MPKTKKRELSPPEQRRILRRAEEDASITRKLAVQKAAEAKQDLALARWANIEK